MKLSPTPTIHDTATVTNSTFGRYTEIGASSIILNSSFDDYSYCGRLCDVANTIIGKFANIASNVRIGPTDHPLDQATMHHFLYRSSYYWDDEADDPDFFAARASRIARIGHDTWIGHGAIIKPEVTVGNGAVVASGAIVTKDVAPYTIVAGIPGAPLRKRLPDSVAQGLEALAWWDWSHDLLKERLGDFRTLTADRFVEKYS